MLFLCISLISADEDPEFAWYLYARMPRVPVVSKKLRTYKNIREVWIIHLRALLEVATYAAMNAEETKNSFISFLLSIF